MRNNNNETYETYMNLARKYKRGYHFQMRKGYLFADVYRMWFYDIIQKAKTAGYNLDITLE